MVRQVLENTSLTRCGDSYYSRSGAITEFKDPSFIVIDIYPLTAADKLNGIAWKGRVQFRYLVSRQYQNRWLNWQDYESRSMFTYPAEMRNSRWRTEAYLTNTLYRKINCTDLPGALKTPAPDIRHVRSDITPALASYVVLEVRTKEGNGAAAIVNQTMRIIRKRLELAGVSAFKVERENNSTNGIVVKLAPLRDPERIKKLISTEARLEIVHIISAPSPSPVQLYGTREEAIESLAGRISPNRRVLSYIERNESTGEQSQQPRIWVIVEPSAIIDENEWSGCTATSHPEQGNTSYVFCSLKNMAENKLSDWTAAKNVNQYIGVVLDGEVRAIAYVKSQLRGGVGFSLPKNHAEQFATASMAGPLPAPVVFEEEGNLKSFRKN
jgi:preprotein translocase subunit SecD